MKKFNNLLRAAGIWSLFVLFFVLAKPLTMALNASVYASASVGDIIAVMLHGLRHDLAVGAYLAAPCALVLLVALCLPGLWATIMLRVHTAVEALAAAVTVTLNAALYGYWRFPLDTTPLFYFATSPSSAMASIMWWQLCLGIVAIILLTALLTWLLWRVIGNGEARVPRTVGGRLGLCGGMLLLCALMFLAIRGGISVATLTPGAVYYSDKQQLNHAAVNPAFSLLYSATHQNDFAAQCRYFDDDTAKMLTTRMSRSDISHPDSTLRVERPDIYIVILESFSSALMPALKGEPIAMRLDTIASTGLLFSNFYANGFRTDRGLTAILSGLPSPPSSALMRLPAYLERKPSIASVLAQQGYDNRYYYGGDANFTNMRGYLLGSGFADIISDTDFTVKERLSKWGVHDGPLFERAIADFDRIDSGAEADADAKAPRLWVLQTSSSHEPFEVPSYPEAYAEAEPAVRAFAYTDSVVGGFVEHLRRSSRWGRSLVILVPDHWGAWPHNLDDDSRHRIPLIVTGGALATSPAVIDTYGSQTDIAPTLMRWLGLDYRQFTYGKPLTDPGEHYGYWFDSTRAGLRTTDQSAIVEIQGEGEATTTTEADSMLRALLQILHTDLSQTH